MATIVIDGESQGMRLDRFLRKRLPLYPLSQIYRLMRQGDVRVNGKKQKESYRLIEGDSVDIRIADAELATSTGSSPTRSLPNLMATEFFRRNFRILYEDDAVIVCNKPEGLVVHGGTGHATSDSLIDLARSYLHGTSPHLEPDLVHRLDRDTSGAIIIAKSKQSLRFLNEKLRDGFIRKEYLAVCHGRPSALSATIELEMVKTFGKNDGTKMKIEHGGAATATSYAVTESHGGVAKLQIDLHTGKTHQIRVHLAHIGHPLVGDVRYGDEARDTELFGRTKARRRLYLHAHRVRFPHPVKGRDISVAAPVPEEFDQLMRAVD